MVLLPKFFNYEFVKKSSIVLMKDYSGKHH